MSLDYFVLSWHILGNVSHHVCASVQTSRAFWRFTLIHTSVNKGSLCPLKHVPSPPSPTPNCAYFPFPAFLQHPSSNPAFLAFSEVELDFVFLDSTLILCYLICLGLFKVVFGWCWRVKPQRLSDAVTLRGLK